MTKFLVVFVAIVFYSIYFKTAARNFRWFCYGVVEGVYDKALRKLHLMWLKDFFNNHYY